MSKTQEKKLFCNKFIDSGVDRDTEFLTPNGWKKISDYRDGDYVLEYNKETGNACFQVSNGITVERCNELNYFKNSKGLDQILANGQKMLVFKGYKGKGYSHFDYIPGEINSFCTDKGYYSFETTFNKEGSTIFDTDIEIRIAVMIAADGCIRYSVDDKLNKVELHFSKDRKIIRAKYLLEEANIDYKYKKYNNGTTFFYLKLPKKYNKDLTRFYNANSNQLKVLSSESLKWDGHEGYRSYYVSTNKNNIDLVQYSFAASGIRAGISEHKQVENQNKVYTVIPTKNSKVSYCNSKIIEPIDGLKYSLSMPTGYFVARRNGKIFITGA